MTVNGRAGWAGIGAVWSLWGADRALWLLPRCRRFLLLLFLVLLLRLLLLLLEVLLVLLILLLSREHQLLLLFLLISHCHPFDNWPLLVLSLLRSACFSFVMRLYSL